MGRFKKWILIIFFLFCHFLSVLFLLIPDLLIPAPSPPAFRLQDAGGRVALYSSNSENTVPLEIYDIYTRLLPEKDAQALRRGVDVADEQELQRLLEDYGL